MPESGQLRFLLFVDLRALQKREGYNGKQAAEDALLPGGTAVGQATKARERVEDWSTVPLNL